jgi:ketosteroid isomerase-like protein
MALPRRLLTTTAHGGFLMNQSNAAILQAALASFANGDVPAVLAACDENIECHIPGANLVSGRYHGHDELLGFFKKLHELSGATIKVAANEIFDNGSGTVLATVTITAERGGRQACFDAIQNWRFVDGKAASLHYYFADQSEPDAFWV